MQPSLIVVGLSYPGSSLAVRERFWLDIDRRLDALIRLGTADGIDELAILVNAERTEFIIWAGDLSVAASSVLTYLTGEHGLRLCEWKNFYRLVDETALGHLLRISSGLESRFSAGVEIMDDIESALNLGLKAGATGPHLQSALEKVLVGSAHFRRETGVGFAANVPLQAALDIATQRLGGLTGKRILVFRADSQPELWDGDSQLGDIRTVGRLAGGRPSVDDGSGVRTELFQQYSQRIAEADALVFVSSAQAVTVSEEQARAIVERRKGAPLLVFDLAVPRAIEPSIGAESGFVVHNIDEVREAWEPTSTDSVLAEDRTQRIIACEAKEMIGKLQNSSLLSASMIEYARIKELCREVAHSYTAEVAASEEQARAIEGVSTRIASRLSSYLNAEHDDRKKQTIIGAVRRLFHDSRPPGTVRSEN